jgi:hypothetical protein
MNIIDELRYRTTADDMEISAALREFRLRDDSDYTINQVRQIVRKGVELGKWKRKKLYSGRPKIMVPNMTGFRVCISISLDGATVTMLKQDCGADGVSRYIEKMAWDYHERNKE